MVSDRQAARKAYDKTYKSFNDLTAAHAAVAKRVKAERALIDAERRLANVDARFVEHVDRFEYQRLDEAKVSWRANQ